MSSTYNIDSGSPFGKSAGGAGGFTMGKTGIEFSTGKSGPDFPLANKEATRNLASQLVKRLGLPAFSFF